MRPELANFKPLSIKDLPKEDWFAPGHRACQGCGTVIPVRLALKVLGPNTIAVSSTGCMEVISSPFPYTSWKVPWIHVGFENAASVASGIDAAIKALKRKGKLSKKERINVVVFAGDGATFDIGLQFLSGALERGDNIIYICLDNEAYMNTGVQRSGGTPKFAHTTTSPAGKVIHGNITWKKDLDGIVIAHKIPYFATASIAFYMDYINKVKKASLVEGPAFIHVYSPCPTGWGAKSEDTILLARLVVETRLFPLFEVIDGKYYILNRKVDKPKPVEEYLKLQRRFRHLTKEEIELIQQKANEEYERLVKLCEVFAPPKEVTKEETKES
jgi:pyruvate ferredoxin oxidoreductase beta subunit